MGIAEHLQVSEADSPGTGRRVFVGNALSTVALSFAMLLLLESSPKRDSGVK